MFAFGSGMQGQLGIGTRPMQHFDPQELTFPSPKAAEFNEPIARISASAFNSAAFNEHSHMYIWGSATDHKLGLGKVLSSVDEPLLARWTAEKVGFYTESGKPAVRYQLHFAESTDHSKDAAPVVTKMRAIGWGDSHGVMLDTKGRLFSMGLSNHGRLGLSDKELIEVVKEPTQITFGLPRPSF